MAEYYVQRNTTEEQASIRRFVFWSLVVTFAGAALLIAFIMAARLWLPLIPFESEKQFADRYVGLFAEAMESDDAVRSQYVEDLVDALAEDMALPEEYEVTVHYVDAPDENAFATLGGHVFVFGGLLATLESENALAMVIAHELAHVAHRDPLVGTGRALMLTLLFFAVTGQGGAPTDVVNMGGELALLTYSRAQEREADLEALEVLQRRYGHVGGATAFFEHVLTTEAGEVDADGPTYLASHPQLQERVDYLREHAAASGWAEGDEVPLPPAVAIDL